MKPRPAPSQAGDPLGHHQRVVEALDLAGSGDHRKGPPVRDLDIADRHRPGWS
jgi:hypothetical protein